MQPYPLCGVQVTVPRLISINKRMDVWVWPSGRCGTSRGLGASCSHRGRAIRDVDCRQDNSDINRTCVGLKKKSGRVDVGAATFDLKRALGPATAVSTASSSSAAFLFFNP